MPAATVVAQAATPAEISVLACLATPEPPAATRYHLIVAGVDGSTPVECWERIGPLKGTIRGRLTWRSRTRSEVWFAKLTVGELKPDTVYRLELVDVDRQEIVARATGRTLPAVDAAEDHLNVVFGSCHAIQRQPPLRRSIAEFLSRAYQEFESSAGPISFNLWLGDQVYVDDHVAENLRLTDPHEVIVGCYANTWGLDEHDHPSGLAAMMRRSSNWYLPDDHEFWNDYPRASWTLPVRTARRVGTHLRRYVQDNYLSNRRPRIATMPHPYDQGLWGRTAGAAYMAFQSPDRRRHHLFDTDTSPELVQEFDAHGVKFALVDTRWRRTMSKTKNPIAGFMTAESLQHLERILAHDGPVVLGLSRPVIGRMPNRGFFNEEWESGPESYRTQYLDLWRALAARMADHKPTIILAGDVHEHSIKATADGTLAEFTCPAMALLPTLRPVADGTRSSVLRPIMNAKGRAVRWWWRKAEGRDELTHVDPSSLTPAPADSGDRDSYEEVQGHSLLAKAQGEWEGLSLLTIDNKGADGLVVTCTYRVRNTQTGEEQTRDCTLKWSGRLWHP